MKNLDALTITEISREIREGTLSSTTLVEACLKRIDGLESSVQAWVTICLAEALQCARELDGEARAGKLRGTLHGVPIGIKDIYSVAGVTTTAGARGFADQIPPTDATTVKRLKAAGTIILGKTATTEFAYTDPATTRNPWNFGRTPGGSSSGSAAAVAAGMVPVALGSQTVGSTLRPAAYCGVVGLKPSYGRVSRAGIFPLAWSLDHVGIFGRSVSDVAHLLQVLAGPDQEDPTASPLPAPDYQARLSTMTRPRLGLVRQYFLDRSTPEMAAHIESTSERLRSAGAVIEELPLPESFPLVHAATRLILAAEAAALHEELFRKHADEYRPRIRATIEAGTLIPAHVYFKAQRIRRRFQREMMPILDRVDALVMPVTPGPAPDLTTTGDGSFCAPWSFAGLPAISVPSGFSNGRLPLAIQLVGRSFAEERLLAVAHWCESIIGRMPSPVASDQQSALS
jgi:aspartyl-tRNA(Asn)/glutamyl-tRNA(Gln) amidotransferase subunit A